MEKITLESRIEVDHPEIYRYKIFWQTAFADAIPINTVMHKENDYTKISPCEILAETKQELFEKYMRHCELLGRAAIFNELD